MKKLFSFIFILVSIFLFSCKSSKLQDDDLQLQDESSLLKEPEDFEEPIVYDLDAQNINTQDLENNLENSNQTEQRTQENTQKTVQDTQNTNQTTQKNNQTAQQSVSNSQKNNQNSTANNQTAQKNNQTTQSTKQNTPKTTSSVPKTNQITPKTNQTVQKNNQATQNTQQKNETQNIPKVTSNEPNKNVNQEKNDDKKLDNDLQFITDEEPSLTSPEEQEEKEEIIQPITEEKEIIQPSRNITLNLNETLSITYPGYGWIYLGSDNQHNNLISTGRKTKDNLTIYTLTAKNTGTQIHHFYKVDSISGKYIDDYIEVTVTNIKGSVYNIVKAPDYADLVPQKPVLPFTKEIPPLQEDQITEQTTNNSRDFITYEPELETEQTTEEEAETNIIPEFIESLSSEDLLQKAQELFSQKNYIDSLKYVNSFLEISTDNRDAGLYLQAQIFEQEGKTKNIKQAINIYESIIQNYPTSKYWDDANKRKIYLNRFYIQIR